jgi:recombination protein RecR
MKYPKSISNLIDCFKDLPGIGEKTAERLAFTMINFNSDKLEGFSNAIIAVKDKIRRCAICHNISEQEECDICCAENRDKEIICVVEEPKNIILFEKYGIFNGQYHVLNGLISPLNGINPEDINISSLIDRIHSIKVKEVIIAIKPTLEGEATALYISKLLQKTNVHVSKIAQGIPIGVDMDYLDAMTLETALFDRKKIS